MVQGHQRHPSRKLKTGWRQDVSGSGVWSPYQVRDKAKSVAECPAANFRRGKQTPVWYSDGRIGYPDGTIVRVI